MTWSIIARDPSTGQFGIAVATKFFAVGARVPHIAAGIGGIATQALVNPYYGIDGLKLLHEGREPADIVKTLIAGDGGRESRQLHIMDAKGRWGSCRAGPRGGPGSIRYSWRLALAPFEVADYVAAHECAHLVHPNHGAKFWALVERLVGDPEPHRAWLRDYGPCLHAFGRL